MTREELKARVCAAIDAHREEIIAIGEEIFANPEMGYKEYHTAAKVKAALEKLGLVCRDQIAITGVAASIKGKTSGLRIAVMGELDAVAVPGHRCADPLTGAAHACGHNAQIASVIGVAYGMLAAGVMDQLGGDVVLMAVPAEEYAEIEFLCKLRDEGKIHFMSGKQEFIRLGEMDDIDMVVRHHLSPPTAFPDGTPVKASLGGANNGFVSKTVRFIGKESHSGGAPHLGVNALNAAMLGLAGINAVRETFQDKDRIRIPAIMTKGGESTGVIPADVRLEVNVSGASLEAIADASKKVNRALRAGAMAIGAEVEINELPGYLPRLHDQNMVALMRDNLTALLGAECIRVTSEAKTSSSDTGDISQLMPLAAVNLMAATGLSHGEDYEVADKELAYIISSKALAMTIVDLLADDAAVGKKIKAQYQAPLTKETYLKTWEEFLKQ